MKTARLVTVEGNGMKIVLSEDDLVRLQEFKGFGRSDPSLVQKALDYPKQIWEKRRQQADKSNRDGYTVYALKDGSYKLVSHYCGPESPLDPAPRAGST